MSEHDFISKFNELKEEYATKKGWNEDDTFWYEDDEHLYEAECYAYEVIEKEDRLNNYDFVMRNYLKDCFFGAKLLENSGALYIVEYEGKKLNIEFNPEWEEYVYTVNGKGPFSHSSYEYIGQDCRQVLVIEAQEREKLAVKLNTFYKNFDHYSFMDCLDGEVTEDILDVQLAEGLNDPETVASVLKELNDIMENGELDEEQTKEIEALIAEVSAIQERFGKSFEDKLAEATERSSLDETVDTDKEKTVEERDI